MWPKSGDVFPRTPNDNGSDGRGGDVKLTSHLALTHASGETFSDELNECRGQFSDPRSRPFRLSVFCHLVGVIDSRRSKEQMPPTRVLHSIQNIHTLFVVSDARTDIARVANVAPFGNRLPGGKFPRKAMRKHFLRLAIPAELPMPAVATDSQPTVIGLLNLRPQAIFGTPVGSLAGARLRTETALAPREIEKRSRAVRTDTRLTPHIGRALLVQARCGSHAAPPAIETPAFAVVTRGNRKRGSAMLTSLADGAILPAGCSACAIAVRPHLARRAHLYRAAVKASTLYGHPEPPTLGVTPPAATNSAGASCVNCTSCLRVEAA